MTVIFQLRSLMSLARRLDSLVTRPGAWAAIAAVVAVGCAELDPLDADIEAPNRGPLPRLMVPSVVATQQEFTADARDSFDSDGLIAGFYLMPGDGRPEIVSATGRIPVSYALPGEYEAFLRVRDEDHTERGVKFTVVVLDEPARQRCTPTPEDADGGLVPATARDSVLVPPPCRINESCRCAAAPWGPPDACDPATLLCFYRAGVP